ncbi:MAG: hypothetical protein NVS2B16_21520 [Chloroflexota bacterium]
MARAVARYASVSGLLVSSSIPATALVGRHYGLAAGRRFRSGMLGTLVVQQVLAAVALLKSHEQPDGQRHQVTIVDLMTLSRGCASAMLAGLVTSGIRDRRGVAGWMGWLALVYGAILCDWLDGPIARHRGTSAVGALFDL